MPVIFPTIRGAIGGMETRAWMFARELARRPGMSISFALHDSRRAPRREVDGVTLALTWEPLLRVRRDVAARIARSPRFPWLRIESWDSSLVWKVPLLAAARPFRRRGGPLTAIRHLPVDVHCVFGVNRIADEVIALAKSHGGRVILFLAGDVDLDERILTEPGYVDSYGESSEIRGRVLRRADAIVAQSPEQRQMLEQRFERTAEVIGNPVDVEAWDRGLESELPKGLSSLPERFILWIGRAETTHKRPQLCITATRQLRSIPFVMVMNPRDRGVEKQIRREAPPHVRIVSHVPPAAMPAVMRRAAALVNTSSQEGLPNTFLQAALTGIPVVTLEAGEELLARTGAGVSCRGDMGKLIDTLAELWRSPPPPGRLDEARRTVIEQHGLIRQADRLQRLIEQTAAAGLGRSAAQ